MTGDLDVALQRFNLGHPLEPPVAVAEAWSNEVYRVRVNRGVYAIKLFPPNLPALGMQVLNRAVDFERRVLAADLAVPTPVLSDTGDIFVDFAVPQGVRTARCHQWECGTPASQLLEDSDIAAAAGQMLGQLHAMHFAGGDTSQLTGPDQGRWNRAVDASAAECLPWADEMTALAPLIRQLAERIQLLRQQRRPMQVSHRDFDPKNAVVDSSGRLFVTDWDYAGPVLPGVELVTAAASFARSDEQLRQFAESYRDAGGDAEPADALALSIEVAELDWVLRNVEAVVSRRLGPSAAEFQTASDLISSFATSLTDLQSWSRRLRDLLG